MGDSTEEAPCLGFVSLDMTGLLHSTGCAGSVRKARGLDNKESA
jgi:hypothetical protein